MKKNVNLPAVHSSAAEYLTFVAASGDSEDSYEMRYQDENIWLTQKMMAALYDVSVQNIGQHIKKILDDSELTREATIKKFFIVQNEGARQVEREVDHYNLQMIIAVGFKVNNERAVRFRKWAGQIVKDHTIQGWTMDVERLKKGHMFTDEYFERQLQYIREIRLSERKFYQKVTDIYATAVINLIAFFTILLVIVQRLYVVTFCYFLRNFCYLLFQRFQLSIEITLKKPILNNAIFFKLILRMSFSNLGANFSSIL